MWAETADEGGWKTYIEWLERGMMLILLNLKLKQLIPLTFYYYHEKVKKQVQIHTKLKYHLKILFI